MSTTALAIVSSRSALSVNSSEPRDGLDHVEQELARVARVAAGQGERIANAVRDGRDLQDVGVHRGDREESDEAMLEDAAVTPSAPSTYSRIAMAYG